MSEVVHFLLKENKEHYERMVKTFPDEPIWKKALGDTNRLLEKEGSTSTDSLEAFQNDGETPLKNLSREKEG